MGWLYGPQAGVLAGLAAFFGHLFPMWLGFKGGKGVATTIGVLFGLYWPLGLIFIAVWIVMALLFRISSLSALTASFLSPFAAYARGPQRPDPACRHHGVRRSSSPIAPTSRASSRARSRASESRKPA